jgi:DNA-binding LytR/AlgR family response regulator
VPAPPAEPELNEFGLPVRTGFRALTPYRLGLELVSLSSEDHYVRVVTDRGNALIRYRFSDALNEVKGLPGIQVHRSHWVAVRAIDRVAVSGKAYRLILNNGTEVPVSRTNVGVLRASGLL